MIVYDLIPAYAVAVAAVTDYSAVTSLTVMFLSSAAVTPQCAQVLLEADNILEGNQVFVAQIDSSVPDVTFTPGEQFATVTIVDGNSKPIMLECAVCFMCVGVDTLMSWYVI